MRGVLARVFLSLLLWSCNAQERPVLAGVRAPLSVAESERALLGYAELALAVYEDCVLTAEALNVRVRELVRAPSPDALANAQQAWLRARVPYAQSEVFRFYDGPIDALELAINTWPIDEQLVDTIVSDVKSYPLLTTALLRELNARDGETSISTGYHVIEFLLWGRDDNERGPGQRAADDFASRRADDMAARRGQYLQLASQLMLTQLRAVRDAWRAGPKSFRARWLQPPHTRALYWALKGMAKLSGPELAGERITVPYETKDQENEHSCFSDSTASDLVNNALGVQNVCTGSYVRTSGERLVKPGLCALLRAANASLAAALTAQIDESVRALRAIPEPFDRAIQGADDAPARQQIARAIASLRSQAQQLENIRQVLTLNDQEQP